MNAHDERDLFLGRLALQAGMALFMLACLWVQRRADRRVRLTLESALLLNAQGIVAGALALEWMGEASGRGFPIKQLVVFLLPWWGVYLALRLFKVRGDRVLLPLACYLTGLGWVQILRIDFVLANKQVVWVMVSLTVFALTAIFLRDYQRLRTLARPLLVAAVALQAGVLFVGVERNGARLWYSLGSMLFQPVEIVKVLAVLILASWLSPLMDSPSRKLSRRTLATFAVGWGATEALLVLEKDLGMALLFFGVFLAMFYVSTGRIRWVLGFLALFALGACAGYVLFPHVRVRFQAWADPLGHFEDSGYQISQALFALAWGGPWGVGPGMGDPTRIPEAATDFIYVSFCEEMGGVGGALLLAGLALLVYRALRASRRCQNSYGMLLGVGLGTVLAWQTLILIYGTLKLAPMTGVTVPFVSYGGSSLVSNFLILAFLQRLTQDSGVGVPRDDGVVGG